MRFDVRPAATGGWLALAAGPRLLVLPELDDAAGALESLAGADGFRSAVDLLAARGLTAMPPFVLIESTGEPRLIVRGAVSVTIEDAAGRREVDAASVSTWVEQVVPGLVAVEVTVPGAVAAIDRALPIREGVALAASLLVSIEPAATEPAPVPVVADQDEPEIVDPETVDLVEPAATPEVEPAPAVPLTHPSPPAPPTAASRVDAPPPPPPPLPEVDDDSDPYATVLGPFDADPTTIEPSEHVDVVAPPVEVPEAVDDGYDYLFGETVFRSVSEAAVPEVGDEAAAPDVPKLGDHDGETILSTDLAKIRGDRTRGSAPAPAAVAVSVPPSVVLPNGSRERLDQPLIFGRSPSASQVTAGSIPKLITLGSGDQDISRSHVRFALEGDTVVVTDLHSVNGTSVVMPGRDPQRLRAGEPAAVIPGTVVDLGGGVTLTVVDD